VRFTNAEEDAKRRDFTVNALFLDFETGKVIDYVGGQIDIAARVIRAVGDPNQRFAEDKLRLLRAVRFAAQLDFNIEGETYAAIARRAVDVGLVSRERVRVELEKLILSEHPQRGLELMRDTGLLAALFPQLAAAASTDEKWFARFAHLAGEKALPKDQKVALAFTLFFLPVYQGQAKALRDELKALRFDSALADAVVFALQNQGFFLEPTKKRDGEMVLLLANAAASVAGRLALILGLSPENHRHIQMLRLRLDRGERPEPLISGEDAKSVGFVPGREMGQVLHEAYLLQLELVLKTREQALTWLKAQRR
jgi:poly(A) polymerase